MGNDVEVERVGARRAEDVAFGGYADGPFNSIRKCKLIHNIESPRAGWSRNYTGKDWNGIVKEFPTGCERELLNMGNVDGGNDGGKFFLLRLLLIIIIQFL